MNQRKASARYYLFEDMIWEVPSFAELRKRRAMRTLRYLAARVWLAENARGPVPDIHPRLQNDFSEYVHDDRIINLAKKHRSIGGLLHELAHALGPNDKLTHGPAFRKRCFRLYQQYGGWSGKVDW